MIYILNVYGSFIDRKIFREKVNDSGLLAHRDLIIAGDINLIVSAGEVWGDLTLLDPLATYFKDIFLKKSAC
jgi:hypothetical protein